MGGELLTDPIACLCGRRFERYAFPIYCRCGKKISSAADCEEAARCLYRSREEFELSCRCGSVNRCSQFDRYCADRDVTDQLVNITDGSTAGELITADNFRCCKRCDASAVRTVVKHGSIRCIESGRAVQTWSGGEPVEADVVIPSCAADAIYLADAVESILAQEHARPWIHVIADGCEWPNLPTGPRILRYDASGGLGPYRLTNALASRFRTRYVAIQDADDISTPDRLWRQIRTLELTGYDMISGSMEQFVAEDCRDDETLQNRCKWNPVVYCGMCYAPNPAGSMVNSVKTMTVDLFRRLGGFCDWLMSADHEWDSRAAAAGAKLFHAVDVFGRRRLHNRSLSNGVFPEGHPDRHWLASLMVLQRKAIEDGEDPAKFGGIANAPTLSSVET